MPQTYVDKDGSTYTGPTKLENAEYVVTQWKQDVDRAVAEIDKTLSKLETASGRLKVLLANDNVQAATEPVFYAILDVFGEPYNKKCFRGDPYYVHDWQGLETEKQWLLNALGGSGSKYDGLIHAIKLAEDGYKNAERVYGQKAGKPQTEIDAAFADRSIFTNAKSAGDERFAKLQQPVVDFRHAEEQAKAAAASEAEIDKYRLHRRHWDEDKGPVPKEDQEKYNAIQEDAKTLLKKVNTELKEFKHPELLMMKRHYYEQLFYGAQEESDSTKFVEDNKKRLDDAEIDVKDFEGKSPEVVMERKFKDLIQNMKTNKARRRELLEDWQKIQMKMNRELREYDADLETAVPGFEGAGRVLMERDS